MADINFTKGSNSVDLYAERVDEEFKNKLITLTLSTTSSNQASGAKTTKIVDLLRITQQYSIKCGITSTPSLSAKQIKAKLKLIASGSGQAGGTTTLTYDGDSIEGYIESLTFSNIAKDYTTGNHEIVKYECQITFVKGESAT